ncbi:hypothetical protein J6590_001966 [Homalodisca vitripennis]|nr:hypothetical protein J6590_001966 [Homalodisca vitripennis]
MTTVPADFCNSSSESLIEDRDLSTTDAGRAVHNNSDLSQIFLTFRLIEIGAIRQKTATLIGSADNCHKSSHTSLPQELAYVPCDTCSPHFSWGRLATDTPPLSESAFERSHSIV